MTDYIAAPTARNAAPTRLRIGRRAGYAGAIAISAVVWTAIAVAARAVLG